MGFLLIGIGLIVIGFIVEGVKKVPENNAWILEKYGRFYKVWTAGIHYRCVLTSKILRKVSLKESVASFPPHPVLTQDKVMIRADMNLHYAVVDAKVFTYEIENPFWALEEMGSTTLREIISKMTLDEVVNSREIINLRLSEEIKKVAERWGVNVFGAKVNNIILPADIQYQMEKKAKELIEAEKVAKIAAMRKQAIKGE